MKKKKKEKNTNVIGPINAVMWNNLKLYRQAIAYHKSINNKDVVDMVEPVYNNLLKNIRKDAA